MSSIEDEKKVAKVQAQRLEEKKPGLGAPLGWLPEIVYRVTATEIPRRRYVFTVQPSGLFTLRWFTAGQWSPLPPGTEHEKGTWDVTLRVGPRTVFEKKHETLLHEESPSPRLPLLPVTIRPGVPCTIILEPRGEEPRSTFEFMLRGVEESVENPTLPTLAQKKLVQ